MAMGVKEILNRFGYHPATPDTAPQHARVRQLFADLASVLDDALPDGRDKSLAITELQSSMHWANSAIAMQTPVALDPERARQ